MKAVLEFDLRNEDDKRAFDDAIKASSLCDFVWKFDQKLRSLDKYCENQQTTWEEVRQLWYTMCEENDVNFE